jgi:hypothetical protein
MQKRPQPVSLLAQTNTRGFKTQYRQFGARGERMADQDTAYKSFQVENYSHLWEVHDRTSVLVTLSEAPGMLNKALNILTSN